MARSPDSENRRANESGVDSDYFTESELNSCDGCCQPVAVTDVGATAPKAVIHPRRSSAGMGRA